MDENKTSEPVNETPASPLVSPASPSETPAAPGLQTTGVDDEKVITYLCYLGLLVVIPLLVKKDSPFVKFHAKQGLVIAIGWFIGGFLYPLLGLGLIIHVALIVLSVIGLINVNNGAMKDLPVVGNLAKKFNF